MNINEFHPTSGRFVKEDGTTVNIADELGGKSVSDKVYDINNMMPHSGRFIKEDGTCVNIADMIENGDIGGGGGDSGSSDDSAPPIVEVYNGQTIQCSMSADRPLKGLNLYATTEQATTTGAQLFDASLMPTTSEGGATVTNNGDGSFTISGEGQLTESFTASIISEDVKKMLKAGSIYTNGKSYVPEFYVYGTDNANGVLFSTVSTGRAVVTNEILESLHRVRVVFYSPEGSVITPVTFFPMIWQTGDGTYEPYTGGKPSPSPDYPQEIQTIPNFVVEVKNSMGEGTAPQTLNVTIPEHGFYGIPVSSGGNYTDASGKQWICDEFDFANKKFIKRIGRTEFDGSLDEKWVLNSTTAASVRFYIAILGANTKSGQECWCNRAKFGTDGTVGKCFTTAGRFYIDVDTSINTTESWKQYLSTHELDVIYKLETPVEYDLTDEQVEQFKKLKSYYGTTYIDNGAVPACNMQAELVLDTKLYIDSKFATLAGQILEVGA